MHLGRSVGDAEGFGADQHGDERHLVGHPEGAVQVQGPLHDVVEDLGHRHLDGGNVLADPLVVVVLVDQPGRPQDQQAELLDLDPAVRDAFLRHL